VAFVLESRLETANSLLPWEIGEFPNSRQHLHTSTSDDDDGMDASGIHGWWWWVVTGGLLLVYQVARVGKFSSQQGDKRYDRGGRDSQTDYCRSSWCPGRGGLTSVGVVWLWGRGWVEVGRLRRGEGVESSLQIGWVALVAMSQPGNRGGNEPQKVATTTQTQAGERSNTTRQ
jgi:hypothetical protein